MLDGKSEAHRMDRQKKTGSKPSVGCSVSSLLLDRKSKLLHQQLAEIADGLRPTSSSDDLLTCVGNLFSALDRYNQRAAAIATDQAEELRNMLTMTMISAMKAVTASSKTKY